MLGSDRKLLTWCTVLFLVSGLSVACDDDGGNGVQPGTDVNAEGAASAVDSVVTSFFEGNEALGSLEALGAFIQGVTAQPTVASAAGLDRRSFSDVDAQIRASLEALREFEGSRPAPDRIVGSPLIPDALLGATCIWDPNANNGQGAYVEDLEAPPGAPQNGIRFRLYTIDPATNKPELPLNDIGFIDITDDSNFDATPIIIDVGLTAVVDGVGTLLDYSVTGDFSQTTFVLNMLGSVGDGANQLSFDFSIGGNNADGSFTSSFNMILGTIVVSLEFSTDASGAGGITALITDSATDDVIEFLLLFDAAQDISAGSGILVNDNLVAVISGNLETGAFLTRADGSPLTDAEVAALADLFDGLGSLFDAFGELFALGVGIVGISVI